MKNQKNENNLPQINPIEAFNILVDHPLKMQIFFYLSTFKELSLSELTEILEKSKTTIHHHTRSLEQKGILIAREQVTKNFREKYYEINPKILELLQLGYSFNDAIKKDEFKNIQLSYLLKAFSAFVYSALERFCVFLEKNPKEILINLPKTLLNVCITDYKHYEKAINSIIEITEKVKSDSTNSTPSKDSYAIFTACIPYGKLFTQIIEKRK